MQYHSRCVDHPSLHIVLDGIELTGCGRDDRLPDRIGFAAGQRAGAEPIPVFGDRFADDPRYTALR